MWNTQDYSQSGFGGGGGFGTPGVEDRKKGSRRGNIIPVTVAQILTAKHDGDVFVSGSVELSQVTFVGLIVAVNVTPTRIDYSVDDMTGPPMDVRQFNNNDTDETETAQSDTSSALPVNTYVRVNGQIRAFGGKRSVNAHKLIPITNMNELSCHILEVIHANAQQQGSVSASTAGFSGGDKKGVVSMDSGNQIPGLTPLQSQIQMIIRSDRSEGGCSLDDICRQLKTVAPKAIRDALEFLSTEGHIYSTIDEEHFQATDV